MDDGCHYTYKPDWAVFAESQQSTAPVAVLELKVTYKRNPNQMTDFSTKNKKNRKKKGGFFFICFVEE
ncbi:hypothetical protein DM01DRAFT_84207 [Hesseltinella vesiculosa]|uniref:Uncharacterized protein n=1 Tax=Hesseltinella vesiculosa TaxID=101127 RepID=A0A1X2G2U3_9FUNG|nr:hypothetical protein DM01DRAFT_84207 [Hesseltinella vesiculosa]